jgi:DNA-binding response OmpR family regulator
MSDRFEVLLVEADELQTQLVDMLLSDASIQVTGVSSARAALEYLRARTPDLVIASFELPDLGGFAICSRLKRVARLAHVPVIVTTDADAGHGISQRKRQQAEAAQVDLLLPRPLGDKNLKERALRLMLRKASEPTAAEARELRNTASLDEALESLSTWQPPRARGAVVQRGEASSPATARPANMVPPEDLSAPAAGTPVGPDSVPPATDYEALRRENEALRRENDELRANVDRLKRKLNRGRHVGRDER